MQRLNYISDALPYLDRQRKVYQRKGWTEAAGLVTDIMHCMVQSVKFILPDGGEMYKSTGYQQKEMDLFRLPYPMICLEFPAPKPLDPKAMERLDLVYCPKRIVLCLEATHPETREVMGVSMWVICFVQAGIGKAGSWMLIPYGAAVEYGQTVGHQRPEVSYNFVEKQGLKLGTGSISISHIKLGEAYEDFRREVTDEIRFNEIFFNDSHQEIQAMIQFMAVLNCENVGRETLPAPEKLNNKRRKADKLPLYEYHVLSLGQGGENRGESGSGGTHASPRMHIRRGHIRKLPTGQTTWVKHTTVGTTDNGVVEKDYALT